MRLPPANRLYRTARWIVSGQAPAGGSAWSSRWSTSARRSSRPAPGPAAVVSGLAVMVPGAAGVIGRERSRPRPSFGVHDRFSPRVLHQHLDLALGLFQLRVAQARQADPLLVQAERFLERQLALLQALDNVLELLERRFERRCVGLRRHGVSFPVTLASSPPPCTRIRTA